MKRTPQSHTDRVLAAAEEELLPAHSRALRIAGIKRDERTAAGLAEQYMKRTRPVFPLRAPLPNQSRQADATKCPRCRLLTTHAKLGDEREILYCGNCRFPLLTLPTSKS